MVNVDPSKILDKKMNRKQFLRTIGIGAIAFTGFAAALRAISQSSSAPIPAVSVGHRLDVKVAAYGGSVYGGKPRAS